MYKNILVGLVVAALVVAGVIFLPNLLEQDRAETLDSTSTSTIEPTNSSNGSFENEDNEIKVFEVEGFNYDFSIKEIRVNTGDTVRIEFTSTEGIHNLVIDEFNIATEDVSADETDTIEFVANKSGSFEFYCDIGNHRAMGMVGMLIVE